MAPAPYLLHVNSGPKQVSDAVWQEWYVKEHLPDLYNAKTCSRASFYEEVAMPGAPEPDQPRKFLALYQTEFEDILKTEEYQKGVRRESELFEKNGSKSSKNRENGDFDARNYKLLQEYDPNGLGEKAAPYIVLAYMNPADEADFEKWYREEHLDMLSKMPTYRRSLRYKIGARSELTQGDTQPYLAIHEVDDLSKAFTSDEAAAAATTPWSKKHVGESKPFIARAFKLVSEQGY